MIGLCGYGNSDILVIQQITETQTSVVFEVTTLIHVYPSHFFKVSSTQRQPK
jgi:hypothetical protein